MVICHFISYRIMLYMLYIQYHISYFLSTLSSPRRNSSSEMVANGCKKVQLFSCWSSLIALSCTFPIMRT